MENGVTLGWQVNAYAKTVYLYPPDKRDIGFTGKIMHGTSPVEGFDLDLEDVWRCYEI